MNTPFIKISSTGEPLPAEAPEWDAVLDIRTNLIWSKESKKVTNWKKAQSAAEKIEFGGGKGRLPTVEELFPLTDRSRVNPAIDTNFFPNTKNDWYWTSTPDVEDPDTCAWSVYFFNGFTGRGIHNGSGFVRAVRVSQ